MKAKAVGLNGLKNLHDRHGGGDSSRLNIGCHGIKKSIK
jgi:hypothetical protein